MSRIQEEDILKHACHKCNKEQLEVAFESLKSAFGDNYEKVKGSKYKADAIG